MSDVNSISLAPDRRRWLILGGILTSYLTWRWTLYVNLVFAGAAFAGGAMLVDRRAAAAKPRLDIRGVLAVSGAVFCLVCGFSHAATHSWRTPSTYGFIAAGVALLVLFALGQQLGASIGTSLLNTIFAGAVASHLTVHAASARILGARSLAGLALAHGYDIAFWWIAGIFAAGAIIGGSVLRRGPLYAKDGPGGPAGPLSETRSEAGSALTAG